MRRESRKLGVATIALLWLAACGSESQPRNQSESARPVAPGEETVIGGARTAGAAQVAGTWTATREICDPEAGPRGPIAPVTLILGADGRYRRIADGKEVRGSFTLESFTHGLMVQLDGAAMLAHYQMRNGHLENWGEGDAVYPCALIFERGPSGDRSR